MATEHIRAEEKMIIELEVNADEFHALEYVLSLCDCGLPEEGWQSNELSSVEEAFNERYPSFCENRKEVDKTRRIQYSDNTRSGWE